MMGEDVIDLIDFDFENREFGEGILPEFAFEADFDMSDMDFFDKSH